MLTVLITGALLFAMFKQLPLQDLGIRFRLGAPELIRTLSVVLPLCPLIVAIQMYVATFAKSFKEAQSYLSFLMMAQMVPGMMATMNTMSTKAWMYYVPWIGQQTLLTDVLGNKPISPVVFVIVGVVNVTLAVVSHAGDGGTAAPRKDYLRTVNATTKVTKTAGTCLRGLRGSST